MARGAREAKWSHKGNSTKAPFKKPKARSDEEVKAELSLPLVLQQACLDIFRDALKPSLGDAEILQAIKGLLYNRDFAAAFGKEDHLRVYASRWSPSRALAYLHILHELQTIIRPDDDEQCVDDSSPLKILCLGGGAGAELVAIASWLSTMRETGSKYQIHASILDIADWDVIVQELHRRCGTPPELSKYASAAAKEANKAMLPEFSFTVDFDQTDVLEWPEKEVRTYCEGASLVTLMFTLNELYSMSIPKTQLFLGQLTLATRPGAFLLVVDSPGSYSTVSVNAAEKKYPMQWLLDHTLLATEQAVGKVEIGPKWEKVLSEDSRWFRLSQELRYPIELENMRYQIHLYKRSMVGEIAEDKHS